MGARSGLLHRRAPARTHTDEVSALGSWSPAHTPAARRRATVPQTRTVQPQHRSTAVMRGTAVLEYRFCLYCRRGEFVLLLVPLGRNSYAAPLSRSAVSRVGRQTHRGPGRRVRGALKTYTCRTVSRTGRSFRGPRDSVGVSYMYHVSCRRRRQIRLSGAEARTIKPTADCD